MFRKVADSDIVVTTYALLRRDLEELEKHYFNSIILDEAQNIKNPNTITARSVRSIKARMRLPVRYAHRKQPVRTVVAVRVPDARIPRLAARSSAVWSSPSATGTAKSLEYLRSRVKPFILRRTKAEVAGDLPPKIESVTYCNMTDEQAELYTALTRKLRDQVLADVESKGHGQEPDVHPRRAAQASPDLLPPAPAQGGHARLLHRGLPSGKFEAFKDMIFDVVEGGHKVLVFSQFVQMLQIIRGWLQLTDIPFCYLDGTSKDRLDQVDRFNNSPEIPDLPHLFEGGRHGHQPDLSGLRHPLRSVVEPPWKSQATDRTHRIGQTRQVFSYKLICQNTVEEKILKLQEMKRGVAEAVIPGQDTWKSLTKEDLEMLFEV